MSPELLEPALGASYNVHGETLCTCTLNRVHENDLIKMDMTSNGRSYYVIIILILANDFLTVIGPRLFSIGPIGISFCGLDCQLLASFNNMASPLGDIIPNLILLRVRLIK